MNGIVERKPSTIEWIINFISVPLMIAGFLVITYSFLIDPKWILTGITLIGAGIGSGIISIVIKSIIL